MIQFKISQFPGKSFDNLSLRQPESLILPIEAARETNWLPALFHANRHTLKRQNENMQKNTCMYKVLLVSGRMTASNQPDSFQVSATLHSSSKHWNTAQRQTAGMTFVSRSCPLNSDEQGSAGSLLRLVKPGTHCIRITKATYNDMQGAASKNLKSAVEQHISRRT